MQIDYPVQANGVWLILPKKWIEPLRERFGFYTWDAHRRVIRLMCSWDTSRERVHELLDALTELAHVN
jgi:threonine aldolase